MPAPDLTRVKADELARELAEKTRRVFSQWEFTLTPEGRPPWFDGQERAPRFDPAKADYFPGNAWWLSELCRLVYTPDDKERHRPWHRDKPGRFEALEERSPFREIHSVHKTGNHAAVYGARSGDAAPFTVLCFRGTSKLRQWIMNLTALPVAWDEEKDPEACVHQGFKILFNRVWSETQPCLLETEGPLIYTGHSLGAALATLAAAIRPPDLLCTFGSPRVGNEAFHRQLAGAPHLRIVNHLDIVPRLPERDEKLAGREFRHGGDLVLLGKSPGEYSINPLPEPPDGDAGKTDDPLGHLAKEFAAGAAPPECLVDHAPASYSARLLEIVLREAIGDQR